MGTSRHNVIPRHCYGAFRAPAQPHASLWGLVGRQSTLCIPMGSSRHQVNPMQASGDFQAQCQPHAFVWDLSGTRSTPCKPLAFEVTRPIRSLRSLHFWPNALSAHGEQGPETHCKSRARAESEPPPPPRPRQEKAGWPARRRAWGPTGLRARFWLQPLWQPGPQSPRCHLLSPHAPGLGAEAVFPDVLPR